MVLAHPKAGQREPDALGVDSPCFSAIVLFKNRQLPQGFG